MIDIESMLGDHLDESAKAGVPTVSPAPFDPTAGYLAPQFACRRSAPVLAICGVAACIALLVGGVMVARQHKVPEAAGEQRGPRYAWVTDRVSLFADRLSIDVDGVVFDAADIDVAVNSDFYGNDYETLELEWRENGVEMRWHIYFASDGVDWWANEIRTYNGKKEEADWVTFPGQFFRSRLGSGFDGDLDVTASEGGATSHLQVSGLRIQAFRHLGANGAVLPTTTTLATPQGLTNQGLTPAPPLATDLPPTGRAWIPEASLSLEMARERILGDCMREMGFEYPSRSQAEWVQGFGAWEPEVILGIRRGGAARALGYVSPSMAGDPVTQATAEMSDGDRQRYFQALMGDNSTVAIGVTLPDGTATAASISRGGCTAVADAHFDDLLVVQEGYRIQVDDTAGSKATEFAATDPRVLDALIAWRECVKPVADAATPNELARSFRLPGGDELGENQIASPEEITVATADAACQQQVELQTVWWTVVADYERALMGDQVAVYDELVRIRMKIIEMARDFLAVNGITPPPLD